MAAALGLGASATMLQVSDAESQTAGMEGVGNGGPVAMNDAGSGAQVATNDARSGAIKPFSFEFRIA
jgi:hypothetical protein